jgi:flagellar basal-body rod protein FlgB
MSTQKQKVIANNLANARTPGYIRQDITFEKELREMILSGNIEGIRGLHAKIVEDRTLPMASNGNNVNASMEMNEMMQNGV